jgi:hypothetical protein
LLMLALGKSFIYFVTSFFVNFDTLYPSSRAYVDSDGTRVEGNFFFRWFRKYLRVRLCA